MDSFVAKVLSCLGVPKALTDASEPGTIIKVSVESASTFPSILLGGSDATSQAEVSMWLSFAIKNFIDLEKSGLQLLSEAMKNLDSVLLTKSYFVGHKYTVADAAIYNYLAGAQIENIITFTNVARWFDNIQHIFRKFDKNLELKSFPKKTNLISCFQFTPSTTSSASATNAVTSDTKDKVVVDKTKSVAVEDKKSKSAKLPPPPTSEVNAPIASSPAAVVTAEPVDTSKLDPSKLDIRCGKVVKCWNHPESDKLLCEEVDVGDGAGVTRNIASGIRAHYTAEEFQGKMVVVLCNLKERAIAGFKSQGMVLCTANKEHTEVKLLEPPASAKVGDRITFPGFAGEVATPAQMVKKKILEGLLPDLKTNEQGVASWQTIPFTVGDSGVVISAMPNSNIS
mmetsp:Transcript_9082/g.13532  ORF Transcript_9082/g.13532 Transcript_9082/m.13532 type:complete len:397 (-) Transcript_9082:44-1234(-)|eukprot:CAMPEP_0170067516 /NCGR_PEP_ID=MMETSP0019_2-20121128/6831_1 /TAXON_ID=98059 /ORGANISM="Dinobryon sp., Strain UTEXLB2267" /LENGTH=396 /DNA_ID=CAMNT_0010274919 /DNA_START=1477 /DNA_END=2667 /DNA_ORIENTATION=+